MTPSDHRPWPIRDRPDQAADRPDRPPPPERAVAEPSLWAKAGLLDPPPRRAKDDRPDPSADAGATTGNVGFEIHEQKSIEIASHEGRLLGRVTDVVRSYVDSVRPKDWDAALPADRRDLIEAMGGDIAEAMRLPHVAVIPAEMAGYGGHSVDKFGHVIHVSDREDLPTTLATLVHEMRHAYQYEVAGGRLDEHPEAESWAANIETYHEPADGTDYDTYATQPVEADAFGFERALGRNLGLDWPAIDE